MTMKAVLRTQGEVSCGEEHPKPVAMAVAIAACESAVELDGAATRLTAGQIRHTGPTSHCHNQRSLPPGRALVLCRWPTRFT